MENIKRLRARAIIFLDGKLVTMYRERDERYFYTFPGGGMEENETETDCVVREVFEEFGISVRPIKKVYTYENRINIESFYLCEWVSGKFGTGTGEEYNANRNNGIYKPTLLAVENIPSLPLMPPQIAKALYEDYLSFGENLSNEIKNFLEE